MVEYQHYGIYFCMPCLYRRCTNSTWRVVFVQLITDRGKCCRVPLGVKISRAIGLMIHGDGVRRPYISKVVSIRECEISGSVGQFPCIPSLFRQRRKFELVQRICICVSKFHWIDASRALAHWTIWTAVTRITLASLHFVLVPQSVRGVKFLVFNQLASTVAVAV